MKKAFYGCGAMAALFLIALFVLGYLAFVRVEGAYFTSNGARIHYTDEGEGEPVVLIHGYGANADLNWRRAGVIDTLVDDFRVITFDLRAHGLSDKLYTEADYGLKMVEDAILLMDHLQIEKAHVAGYSLGGFIALKLAALHPDRLKSVALCAAGWRDTKDETDLLNPYRPPKIKVTVEDVPTPTPLKLAHEAGPSRSAETGYALGPYERPAQALITPLEWKGFAHWVRDFVGDRIVDKDAIKTSKRTWPALMIDEATLRQIDVPIICFIGTRDGLLPYAQLLHEKRPDIDFVLLEGKGHMSTVLSWEFQRKLHAFFLKHRGERERERERGSSR